ncbi:MAG: prolipoprotein diacylglyceryl transferase [Planctomycetota bacterium]|nr:prolipoprotein diacylglyceryl transferase [Planctomycetota bacterium]
MRSVLFDIPLRGSVELGPLGSVPIFGFGLVLLVWLLLGLGWGWIQYRRSQRGEFDSSTLVVWVIIAGVIVWAPSKESLPIYGFGTMLFLAYVAASSLGSLRLKQRGIPGEYAWDAAIWIFVTGLIGGRLFYVVQYHKKMFANVNSLTEWVLKVVNLPDGGLVFYGGVLMAPVFFWLFCRKKGLHALPMADLLIPMVFVGMLFGRIGCLMHGCCYGDYCELPWAITFPPESAPYSEQVVRGFLPDDRSALRSLPLHPTQIYDAVSSLAIACVTWAFHAYRRRDGEVVAMAAILYSINRFTIELLRWDESGKFGTRFTISQWVSFGLLAAGVGFLVYLKSQPAQRLPLVCDEPTSVQPVAV